MTINVRFRIPVTISGELVANLLTVFGLLGIAFAVAGLTGNAWWGVLLGSVEMVALGVVAAQNSAPARPVSVTSAAKAA